MKTAETWALEFMFKAGAGIDEHTKEHNAAEIADTAAFMASVQRDAIEACAKVADKYAAVADAKRHDPSLSYEQQNTICGAAIDIADDIRALSPRKGG